MLVIVLFLICGLSEGQHFNTLRQPVGSVEQLPEQRISRITPAPHSPARNPGRVPVDPLALTLVPIRPKDRGSQPHGAISKAEMGYRTFNPPRENAYVKGELCLEFYDLARGVIAVEHSAQAVTTGIPEMDVVIENTNLASGIYYCRLQTGEFEATHKLILTR